MKELLSGVWQWLASALQDLWQWIYDPMHNEDEYMEEDDDYYWW